MTLPLPTLSGEQSLGGSRAFLQIGGLRIPEPQGLAWKQSAWSWMQDKAEPWALSQPVPVSVLPSQPSIFLGLGCAPKRASLDYDLGGAS
jgi:hypothetical protein